MSMDKIAKMDLDVTAYYRDIKKMNVEFYNQDINTSKLEFRILRNNAPMPLSEINNNSQIILVTQNGAKKVDNLEFEDEMNGILSYTLPNDVLAHTGKVVGEIFINRKGADDTVVVRSFEFSIKDAVINTISADTKLSYIRKFDDLEEIILERVSSIEEAAKNMDDYISKVKQAEHDALNNISIGKDEVELIIQNGKNDITALLTNDTFLKVDDFEDYKLNIETQLSAFNDSLEEKTKNKTDNGTLNQAITDLRNELKIYTDSKKDVKVVPLTLINGSTLFSGGTDNADNVTLTYFSIGNGYFYCQLNGWVTSPTTGTIANLPTNLQISTPWNRGYDVPQGTLAIEKWARIYIGKTNEIKLIKSSDATLSYSLDPIAFIAKGV